MTPGGDQGFLSVYIDKATLVVAPSWCHFYISVDTRINNREVNMPKVIQNNNQTLSNSVNSNNSESINSSVLSSVTARLLYHLPILIPLSLLQ